MIAKQDTRRLVSAAIALLVVALLGSSGCISPKATVRPPESDGENAPASGLIRVRVLNGGTTALQDVVVKFPEGPDSVGQDETYGDIAPGEMSEYRQIAFAYGYAYVAAVVDGEKRVMQPIDFVGEEPLAPGDYTYVLRATPGASEEPGGIDLELRRD